MKVSLVADGVVRDPEGLCSARYHADIVTHGVDYAKLAVGDTISLDGRTLTITSVGKRCHAACALVQSGRTCSLKHNCAFAETADGSDAAPRGKETK